MITLEFFDKNDFKANQKPLYTTTISDLSSYPRNGEMIKVNSVVYAIESVCHNFAEQTIVYIVKEQ